MMFHSDSAPTFTDIKNSIGSEQTTLTTPLERTEYVSTIQYQMLRPLAARLVGSWNITSKGDSMTGYSDAHGDTQAVKLAIDNRREYSDYFRSVIMSQVEWRNNTWHGAYDAAQGLEYVMQSKAREPDAPDELKDANLYGGVNFDEIVSLELQERNVEAGRDQYAELTHRVYRGGVPISARMSESDCWVAILKTSNMSVEHAMKFNNFEIRTA